jgi:membrane-associated phospholipid phosphatase
LIESLGRPLLDNTLAAFDAQCCAGLVVAWRTAFGRPNGFTDLVYLAYLSYYGLPLAVAALAWRRGPAVFEPVVLALLLTFYASYLGYLVWPASGPRVPEADEAAVLGGAAISQAARSFLRAAEWTPWDAFPSGHTAVALVACGLAVHVASPGVVAALCVWALAILFATVYIQVHYVADLLAGALLAALVLWVAARRRAHRRGS